MPTETYKAKRNHIADIRCTSCGAPADYNIRTGKYACSYCGGKVEIGEAQEQQRGFRELRKKNMQESLGHYRLQRASCTGCGAEIVFEENEALTSCAFCGRALVRREYLNSADLPELVIPFRLTKEEAQERLREWCASHRGKAEAKALSDKLNECQGCYLPYELIRGPVGCEVKRIDGGRSYFCGGFIDEVFVNCSAQLDNLLLDAMEPYDMDDLTEFDFAYVAGHQVKANDISGRQLEERIGAEVSASYSPVVRKTLETKAVSLAADISGVVRMPVLLPVYYLCAGELMAAVNGQTGKVSVRALKPSHYYFLPWWLKATLATALISAAAFGVFCLTKLDTVERLEITGMLAIFLFIVTLVAYSDTNHTKFRMESGRKVFVSEGGPFRRKNGVLVQDAQPMERPATPPVFFETLDGKRREVVLKFSTPWRMLRMALLALLVLFLPVVVAVFISGFHFSQINLGASAVWFCIFVPVIPIYLLKFGRIDMYDRPWFYIVSEDGTRIRYREKREIPSGKEILNIAGELLFSWPIALAVWFGILAFIVMCCLTAGIF